MTEGVTERVSNSGCDSLLTLDCKNGVVLIRRYLIPHRLAVPMRFSVRVTLMRGTLRSTISLWCI